MTTPEHEHVQHIAIERMARATLNPPPLVIEEEWDVVEHVARQLRESRIGREVEYIAPHDEEVVVRFADGCEPDLDRRVWLQTVKCRGEIGELDLAVERVGCLDAINNIWLFKSAVTL